MHKCAFVPTVLRGALVALAVPSSQFNKTTTACGAALNLGAKRARPVVAISVVTLEHIAPTMAALQSAPSSVAAIIACQVSSAPEPVVNLSAPLIVANITASLAKSAE
jgi:hypothetical protein